MKTVVVNAKDIERKWFVADATDKNLGRLASKAAQLLRGKGKPAYSPNQDHGDYLIIINAENVALSGNKSEQKEYFRHSTYPSGGKFRSFKEQMALDSAKVVKDAIHGMLPKTTLGRQIIKKLHVYKGDAHPHIAQKPEEIAL